MNKNISIKSLPVYWRIKKQIKNQIKGIPSNFDYSFSEIKQIGLLIQKRKKKLLNFLHLIYKKESNIGFLQEGHSLAKNYGNDFLRFLKKNIKKEKISNILEIGCGACYLLEKLQKCGYKVTGLDPSPITVKEAQKKNFRIFQGFYPSKKIKELYDLIFNFDVLEHVSNPIIFLKKIRQNLIKDGFIAIKVPDCTQSIERGDISFVTHQHLNNFTYNSLYLLMKYCGYEVISLEKSKFGSSLYCFAKKSNDIKVVKNFSKYENQEFLFKAKKVIKKFKILISNQIKKKATIGFYVPLRSFPYIFQFSKLNNNKYRLFDDIIHYRNNYFDGCNVKIENFEDLIKKPVDHLFIMSFPFGNKIKKKILMRNPFQKITTLTQLTN
jgi:SAM-dependent methyltransferase